LRGRTDNCHAHAHADVGTDGYRVTEGISERVS
jgi:hypothetical protein